MKNVEAGRLYVKNIEFSEDPAKMKNVEVDKPYVKNTELTSGCAKTPVVEEDKIYVQNTGSTGHNARTLSVGVVRRYARVELAVTFASGAQIAAMVT